MASKRELILQNLKTTVEAIIAGATYNNTVKFCTRNPIDVDEISDDQIPFCIIDDIRNSTEILTPLTTKDINSIFELDIIAVYRAASNLSTGANSLVEDFKIAIYTDVSRNNNADLTHITSVTMEKTEKKNTVVITFRITVDYIYESLDP